MNEPHNGCMERACECVQQEVERLREAITEAHALMGRHEFDQAQALLSSSINLYGRHFASVMAKKRV